MPDSFNGLCMPSGTILPLVDLMYVLSICYVSFFNSYSDINV